MKTRIDRAQIIQTPRRPRGPGTAYAALSLLLVCLVATVALTSRQAPPPSIAEFAPQAVEQITEASEGVGQDDAGPAVQTQEDEAPGDGAAAAGQTVDVVRVRQCVGDPPRQIEDPQSPPCVPYWSGDNGGATARGVTRDEIRVADPSPEGESAALAAFFNRRFELYGRRIRLIPRAYNGASPEAERASARAVYEQDQAFASTGPYAWSRAYLDELARLGIVGVHYIPALPEASLAARRPYLWLYPMANDRIFTLAGDWYCARFSGRNAAHAGDPLLQASPRKPGIILTDAGNDTSAAPMTARLASCGERAAIIESKTETADYAYYQAFMQNAILQMKTAGVTTLTCLCQMFYVGFAMHAATNQGYFPEWLLTSYFANDTAPSVKLYTTPEQTRSLMMLVSAPMNRAQPDRPSNWASQEAANAGYPVPSRGQLTRDVEYWMLLVLASGFQLAGPRLTAETFERGLHEARFPNPPHRIMAGAVGFRDGDHSLTEDAAEVWWSSTAPGPNPDDGAGTSCYVDHGARRRMGSFPTDDPFFAGACDNGS